MPIDRKYGRVTVERQTIPDDEPVFVIRARDKASIPALLAYAEAAYNSGARGLFIEDVFGSIKRFETFQQANGAKVPD